MTTVFLSSGFLFLISCGTSNKKPSSSQSLAKGKINTYEFYSRFNGHPINDLKKAHNHLRKNCSSLIYLAGDSSLDNKHWLFGNSDQKDKSYYKENKTFAAALPAYKEILSNPIMVRDVNYWLGYFLDQKDQLSPSDKKTCSLMTSVEATTLMNNGKVREEPQDKFIKNTITDEDYLVISVGGNDIAMAPTQKTTYNLKKIFQSGSQTLDPEKEEVKYFITLLKDRVKEYIKKLVGNKKPKKIIIAMIYYPDENYQNSWASTILSQFKYSEHPQRLQNFIQFLFHHATSKIKDEMPGLSVTPVALYEALDGSDTKHYEQAVEPSIEGGKVLAQFYLKKLEITEPLH